VEEASCRAFASTEDNGFGGRRRSSVDPHAAGCIAVPPDRLAVHKISQGLLAEMVGTNRSRINFFMNRFRKLGFIHYNGGLTVNNSLLSVVLRD